MSKENLAIDRAKEEIFSMEMALQGLKTSSELRALRAHWKAILAGHPSVVSQLTRAASKGSAKGWSDAMKHEQRTDPVLQYMFHARDHDIHLEEFPSTPRRGFAIVENFIENYNTEGTVHFHGGTTTQFLPDGTRIDRKLNGTMSYENGTPKVDFDDDYNVKIVRHHLKLEEVRDRSVVYSPPNTGVPLEEQAISFAETVLAWLKKKVVEFEKMNS